MAETGGAAAHGRGHHLGCSELLVRIGRLLGRATVEAELFGAVTVSPARSKGGILGRCFVNGCRVQATACVPCC